MADANYDGKIDSLEIKHDGDRIMIVDLGPLDGRAEDRLEFMGVHPSEIENKAVVV